MHRPEIHDRLRKSGFILVHTHARLFCCGDYCCSVSDCDVTVFPWLLLKVLLKKPKVFGFI